MTDALTDPGQRTRDAQLKSVPRIPVALNASLHMFPVTLPTPIISARSQEGRYREWQTDVRLDIRPPKTGGYSCRFQASEAGSRKKGDARGFFLS